MLERFLSQALLYAHSNPRLAMTYYKPTSKASSLRLYYSGELLFEWVFARRPEWFVLLSPDHLTLEQARFQFPELFI